MNTRRVLVCSHTLPEFDRDSGSRRAVGLIELLRADDCSVTFLSSRAISETRYARALQQMGVAVFDGARTHIEELMKSARFDFALFAYWRVAEVYLPLVRNASPQTRVVIDSVDLHFVRNARKLLARHAANGAGALDSNFGSELVRELNVYAAADAVLTVSQKEADLLGDLIPDPGLVWPVPDMESLQPSPVPLTGRRGILFMGSFRHSPNVDAVEFLCREVVPRVDADLLSQHPIYIVGEKLDETVRHFGDGLPHVRMTGWVPSVEPYLEQVRLSVIPVRYGAGTKRKLLQTLMAGTPAVSTRVGVEGFALRDGEHVLIADEPKTFAAAIERLLRDDELWLRLAAQGRAQVLAGHGREAAQANLRDVIEHVMAREAKTAREESHAPGLTSAPMDMKQYHQLRSDIRQCVQSCVPPGSKVIVLSRGDNELLKLNGRTGWHFPQAGDGRYAGYYPADSAGAIEQLEALRAKGAEYVVFPSTALWWLDHYREFAGHLAANGRVLFRREQLCAVYQLRAAGQQSRPAVEGRTKVAGAVSTNWSASGIEAVRPSIAGALPSRNGAPRQSILILGVYLAGKPNAVEDIVAILGEARHYQITQKWLALGGAAPCPEVAAVTVDAVPDKVPKFDVLNRLLARESLARYDYVLVTDDDVVLPHGFLDAYLGMQAQLGFAIAQPARTPNSYIDHPIVEQQNGVAARQTLFVEIGPLMSFHRSVFGRVFPFDLTSPMGWGYSNAWASLSLKDGFTMGIIDATPVDHSLRPTLAHYDRKTAEAQRSALFEKREALPIGQCFRIEDVIIAEDGGIKSQRSPAPGAQPRISVILPTCNRAGLLTGALESLANQTIGRQLFEVIIVDDGSSDATRDVCDSFKARLPLRYYRQGHSGIAAAKNLGIFLSRAPVVFFFDDDDVADPGLLRQHIHTHEQHPQENRAVLGYTTWSPKITVTPVMNYVTDVGQILFAYKRLQHGQLLDFSYMWGGRSSCKRSLLAAHGIHNQRFLNMQDVELGYRLSKLGLQVVFNREAVSYMIRAITFDEFCLRCVRQGRSQYLLSRMHPDSAIQAYCKQVPDAEKKWMEMNPNLEAKAARVRALEDSIRDRNGGSKAVLEELNSLYEWTFKAFKIQGVVEAMREEQASRISKPVTEHTVAKPRETTARAARA